jgi:hypothetical protein
MKTWTKTLIVTSIAILLTSVAAIFVLAVSAGGTAGGILSTGRSVMAYSDSISLSSTFSSDTATIRTAGKTIVVHPTTLEVDGALVATINKDVSDIEVRVKRGVVTFVADGKSLATDIR